jgi:thiamine kinase-like enzyme
MKKPLLSILLFNLVIFSACQAKENSFSLEKNRVVREDAVVEKQPQAEPLKDITIEEFKLVFPGAGSIITEPLGGGLSGAKIYIATVDGEKYVVRRPTGFFGDEGIKQEFSIQSYMGEIGISPKVVYSDPVRKIIATKFINDTLGGAKTAGERLRENPKSIKNVTQLLRNIHNTDVEQLGFPVREHYFNKDSLDYFLTTFPVDFFNESDRMLIKRILESKWPTADKVLSHNDFHKGNLLQDGEKFWVIDWEATALAHPFLDLAQFANDLGMDVGEAENLLKTYLERPYTYQEYEDFITYRRLQWGFNGILCMFMGQSKADSGEDIRLPTAGEVEMNSLSDMHFIDNFDLFQKRNLYRTGLLMLRASANF